MNENGEHEKADKLEGEISYQIILNYRRSTLYVI